MLRNKYIICCFSCCCWRFSLKNLLECRKVGQHWESRERGVLDVRRYRPLPLHRWERAILGTSDLRLARLTSKCNLLSKETVRLWNFPSTVRQLTSASHLYIGLLCQLPTILNIPFPNGLIPKESATLIGLSVLGQFPLASRKAD